MPIGAVVAGAAGSIGGAAIASSGASKAAKTQANSANYAADLQYQAQQDALAAQQRALQQQQQILSPYTGMAGNLINQIGNQPGIPQFNPGNISLPQYQQFPQLGNLGNIPQYSGVGAPQWSPSGAQGQIQGIQPNSFWQSNFQDLSSLPGYTATMNAALDATQNAALAKGTGLSPVTGRALQDTAGQVASQYIGQYAGLDLQNRQQQLSNALGLSNVAQGEYNTPLQGNLAQYGASLQGALGAGQLGLSGYNAALNAAGMQGQYGLNYSNQINNTNLANYQAQLQGQNQGYSQLFDLLGLSANAAIGAGTGVLNAGNNIANINQNTGQSLGNIAIGAGNAAAAGQTAQAGIWGNALQSLGTLPLQYLMYNQWSNPSLPNTGLPYE
jgi:hypothetical protein